MLLERQSYIKKLCFALFELLIEPHASRATYEAHQNASKSSEKFKALDHAHMIPAVVVFELPVRIIE